MPADYFVDEKHGVVFSRGWGVFTQADFVAHMVQLRADPRFRPEFNQLVDCRQIASMDLSTGQIKELARSSVFSSGSRRAFVAANSVQFGLSRMFASFREIHDGQVTMVFPERDAALAWLDLPRDLALPSEKVEPGSL